MSGARGIAAAGVIAIVVTSAHAAYRFWPVTHGTEICVPAALLGQPADVAMVAIQLPIARIELDLPHAEPAVTETFERVRRIGGWWITGGAALANAQKLRGRPLYLQLTPGQPLWAGGPVEMRPSTVSDSAIVGATNLAGTVRRVREDGYIWLDFPFGWIGVPRDVAARARPPLAPGRRANDPGPIPPAADPGVFAVLRVLPSGRAALVGVIVDGTRY
jgi:hypothetical protein